MVSWRDIWEKYLRKTRVRRKDKSPRKECVTLPLLKSGKKNDGQKGFCLWRTVDPYLLSTPQRDTFRSTSMGNSCKSRGALEGLFLRPVLWPAIKVTGDSNWVFSTKIMVAIHWAFLSLFSFPFSHNIHKQFKVMVPPFYGHQQEETWKRRETRRWFYRNLQPSFGKRVCASSPSFIWPKLLIPTSVCLQLFLHHHLVITNRIQENKTLQTCNQQKIGEYRFVIHEFRKCEIEDN